MWFLPQHVTLPSVSAAHVCHPPLPAVMLSTVAVKPCTVTGLGLGLAESVPS